MKSLEERLEERKAEYEKLIEREYFIQTYLDKLSKLVPESTNVHGNIYQDTAFIFLSFDSVEEFEGTYITKLSEAFDISWRRIVEPYEIKHETDLAIEDKGYIIYFIVRSKPTDSCRITKVATGKTVKISKSIDVEEAEYDYVVECSDD